LIKKYFLKFISIERFLRGSLLVAVGISGLRITFNRTAFISEWQESIKLISSFSPSLVDAVTHSSIYSAILNIFQATSFKWVITFILLMLWGIIILVEAVGLWLDLIWAEYLTTISTSALLPLEIFELFAKFSFYRLAILIINLGVIIWLIYYRIMPSILRRNNNRRSVISS
jgi:uncharacterized membrane protein (DUF2068 family)